MDDVGDEVGDRDGEVDFDSNGFGDIMMTGGD
jgi:hypothetical protein